MELGSIIDWIGVLVLPALCALVWMWHRGKMNEDAITELEQKVEAALETKINEMDADRDVIKGSLEATQVDVGLIQDELAIEGLGGFLSSGTRFRNCKY